jgi:hypothetical protein
MKLENNDNLNPFIMVGHVMDVDDPLQMGRVKVWVPSVDGEYYSISQLPWAEYASPLAGVTVDYPAGRNKSVSKGAVAYGMWAIPPLNAQVLVFCLNGVANRRFYFACIYDYQRNRSLPAGRNISRDKLKAGPLTDLEEPLQPAYNNLRAAFGEDLGLGEGYKHGVYERQVAQARTEKNGLEGYAPSMADPEHYKASQIFCFTTPGHHSIIMNDHDQNCRVRVKSCEGNQVILDDTNQKIYVSTALGNTWIELNENGDIYIYGGKSISMRAQGDVNIRADNNINLSAGNEINIVSASNTNINTGGNLNIGVSGTTALSSCSDININGSSNLNIGTGSNIGLKAGGTILQTASEIHLNGPSAPDPECAGAAKGPSIIPGHEPFVRPIYDNSNAKKQTVSTGAQA